ncbi:MAG: hypothetical protein K6G16_08030 [Lachnospiraceae bacterium]|nr:hypothetical protein [Lachnospiraceae bacterium]
MDRRTVALIPAGILFIISLCGFAFGEVKLRIDHPLIDLSETVHRTESGNDGTMQAERAGERTDISDSLTDHEEAGADNDAMLPVVLTVRVREQTVYLDEVLYGKPDALIRRLTHVREQMLAESVSGQDNGAPFRLVLTDAYADYQTYMETRAALIRAGFDFTEETED